MKVLKILDWPAKRFYGETHHFYRWRKFFLDHSIKIEFYFNHLDKGLKGADYLLIHSRYFENGWQNIKLRTVENESALITYLNQMKQVSGKLIWFDAADSTGSDDFPIISYVDIFLKKQVLKNMEYYTATNPERDLRVWLNVLNDTRIQRFVPCPQEQLYKLKPGWNIGFNDYRYFGYKMSRLSNYLSYQLYPNHFSPVDRPRKYDIAFRGTIHNDNYSENKISYQRNYVLKLFEQLNLNIATGKNVSKFRYWKELRNSRLSVSPFGWGEICYRDFETFIAGAVLIKPVMSHMLTYPNLFIAQETYVPVDWGLLGLADQIEEMVVNYRKYRHIARNGQEEYFNAINDPQSFIEIFKTALM